MNQVDTTSRSSAATRPAGERTSYTDATLTPPVDVIEDGSGITLFADLPGVSRDGLHLHIEADTLTIDADCSINVPPQLHSHHTEVGLAKFHRAFTLSKELDTEKVSAELAQGVLRLRIPKAAHAQPRRIEVQVG